MLNSVHAQYAWLKRCAMKGVKCFKNTVSIVIINSTKEILEKENSEMIRYKVTLHDRTSTFAQDKYRLEYIKDTIVKAIKGTLGIMVFKRRREAEHYKREYLDYGKTGMILRVETLSRGKSVHLASSLFKSSDFDMFYSGDYYPFTYPSPPGTMCYDRVRVLD